MCRWLASRGRRSCWRSCSTRRSTPSSTRASTPGWASKRPTGTGSARLVHGPARRGPVLFRRSARRGATATCASSPHVASRLFLAHIRAPPAHRSSRRTVTRSVTSVAVGPQRRDPRLHSDQARLGARRRPGAVPVPRGISGLRGHILPRADPRAARATRPPRSSRWSVSSRSRLAAATGSRTRCRSPWRPPTGAALGLPTLQQRRSRSLFSSTTMRTCGSCTQQPGVPHASPTTPGSSFPARRPRRRVEPVPSPATASSSKVTTRSTPSGPDCPRPASAGRGHEDGTGIPSRLRRIRAKHL